MGLSLHTNKRSQSSLTGFKLISVALFLILIWGSAFTLVGAAVRTLSPDWLVSYRMMVGAIVVFLYSRILGHRLPPLKDQRWVWYFFLAITGASLPFVLLAHGQKTVDSGLTAIIAGTMPLITIILAHFFTAEKLTHWKLIGFLIGFAGIVILFLPEDLSFALVEDWRSQSLILLAAFFYAATTIIASRAPATPSPIAAAMMLSLGAAMSTIWAASISGPPPIPDMTALLCAVGLGLGSTGAATVIYLWLVDVAGPSVVARINYFLPICSVFLGVTLLDEVLDWRIFVSFFVILVGVIISRIGNQTDIRSLKTPAPSTPRTD